MGIGQLTQSALLIKNSLDLDSKYVCSVLEEELKKYLKNEQWEIVEFLTPILLKQNNKNYIFHNILGNCKRRSGKYQEANNCYKQSYGLNRKFITALHNLAASMARVEKYDQEIQDSFDLHILSNEFLLPDQIVPLKPKLQKKVSSFLLTELKTENNEALQEAMLEKETMVHLGKLNEVKALNQKIKSMHTGL